MLCLIKVNSNTIKLTMHTSCYCFSDLLYVTISMCPFCETCYILNQKNLMIHNLLLTTGPFEISRFKQIPNNIFEKK